MDPFSITVGIVGLVDGGLSLSKELKDKIDTFKDAGSEIVELAHEVDLCTTLVDVLGNGLDRPESGYPGNVIRQTRRLVEDMRNVFDDIRALIADFDYSSGDSARYVLKAEEVKAHHAKLKSLQLSFVFMLSVCPPQRPFVRQGDAKGTTGISTSGGSPSSPAGSFEGTIQQVPIQVNGVQGIGGSTTYTATLTLHPLAAAPTGASEADSHRPNGKEKTSREQDMSDRLEDARKDHELKKKLRNLTRSPFFSKDGFRDMMRGPQSRRAEEAVTYRLSEPILVPGQAGEATNEGQAVPVADTITYADVVEVEVEPQYTVPSDEQAEMEVDGILDYLFDDSTSAAQASGRGSEVSPMNEAEVIEPIVRDYSGLESRRPPSRYSTPPTGFSE